MPTLRLARIAAPALLVLGGFIVACGGPQLPSEVPSPAGEAPTSTPARRPTEAIAATATSDSSGAAPAVASMDAEAPLDVRFIVGNSGLRAEVEGIRLVPTAQAVKVGKGWAVEIAVEVSSLDGAEHVLLAPDASPFAIAGKATRGGQVEVLKDARKGQEERTVGARGSVVLTRRWPADGSYLAQGDQVELEVGLWGLGQGSKRRPLRRLCAVELTVNEGSPAAVVSPP
jgi:hypothetical protein